MAGKTATVLARVDPELKKQAEDIMDRLGIPASLMINMLYKQIILTRSIPFPLSVPSAPVARDEMDTVSFNGMMEKSLLQAKAGRGVSLDDAFSALERGI